MTVDLPFELWENILPISLKEYNNVKEVVLVCKKFKHIIYEIDKCLGCGQTPAKKCTNQNCKNCCKNGCVYHGN